MAWRAENGQTFYQTWDVDNRLAVVTSTTGTQATKYTYDGDGQRVLQTLPDGTKVAYAGPVEVSISITQRITKSYYSAGTKLAAMRVITTFANPAGTLYFLLSDHLGSVSLTTDSAGNVVSVQKFTAWGVVRAASGAMPTDIGFTGRRVGPTTAAMPGKTKPGLWPGRANIHCRDG